MSSNAFLPDYVGDFVTAIVTRETAPQKQLREKTARMPEHQMQISPDEAAFLAMLVKMLDARHVLEIGTYTGYSAMAMAMALPENGKLIACDINKEWTKIALRHWQEAGISGKIELRLGPALETLQSMLRDGIANHFDLVFIDADKVNYDHYYEACLKLVRRGGIIAFDNMLWGGDVAKEEKGSPETQALRALNLKLRDDERVDMCLLTIADGVMLARKRS